MTIPQLSISALSMSHYNSLLLNIESQPTCRNATIMKMYRIAVFVIHVRIFREGVEITSSYIPTNFEVRILNSGEII